MENMLDKHTHTHTHIDTPLGAIHFHISCPEPLNILPPPPLALTKLILQRSTSPSLRLQPTFLPSLLDGSLTCN